MSRAMKKEAGYGVLFAMPWIIGFLVFILYPVISSLFYSFTNFNMYQWSFIDIKNYTAIFKNDDFYLSLKNTLYFTVVSVPLNLLLGVLMGLLLAARTPLVRIYRTIYYLPNVLASVAVGYLWRFLYAANGPINNFLSSIGIEGPLWLSDKWSQIPAMIIMNAWSVGGVVLIFLAAIKGVPLSLYEAARIDGAGWLTQFRVITLPSISPMLYFNFIMGLIGSFQSFLNAYILNGGGTNKGAYFYGQFIYEKAFQSHQMGYASALSWILLVIILAITVIASKASNKFVFYMGD